MRNRKRSGGSRSAAPSTSTSAQVFDHLPHLVAEVDKGTLPSGRVAMSYGYEDPYSPNGIGLFGFQYDYVDVTCAHSGGTLEAELVPLQDFWTKDAYLDLVMKQISKGFVTFNSFGLTVATAAINYMNSFSTAFMALRGLKALVELNGYNRACDAVAFAIWQNRAMIEALTNRLESFPFPPKLRAVLDDLCGVYMIDGSALPPMYAMVAFDTYDLTNQTDIGLLINNVIIPNINNLSGTQDNAFIMKVLDANYGTPTPFGPKPINHSEALYWLHVSQAYMYLDTTSGNDWIAPATGSTTVPDVPIFVHGGSAGIAPYTFTLIRPPVYGNGNNVLPTALGERGLLGFAPNSTLGTVVDAYNQATGAKGASTGAGAGATTGVTLNDFVNELPMPWARVAQLETLVSSQVTTDTRILGEWTRFYIPRAVLADETIRYFRSLLEL